MSDIVVVAGVLAFIALVTLALRRREGRVSAAGAARVDADVRRRLGAPLQGMLLLELTAPSCASCAAARRVLDEVAATRAGVAVHAVDVGDALDLAREHQVLRAPTTLLIDDDGAVRAKIGGVPTQAVLADLLDDADDEADAA